MWSTSNACRAMEGDVIPPSRGGQAMTAFDGGGAILVAGLESPRGGRRQRRGVCTGLGRAHGPKGASGKSRDASVVLGHGDALRKGRARRRRARPQVLSAALSRFGARLSRRRFPRAADSDRRRARPARRRRPRQRSHASRWRRRRTRRHRYARLDRADGCSPLRRGRLLHARRAHPSAKLPTVLRLSTDGILVAGGVDGNGNYVATLEWFSKDGGRCARDVCLRDPPELAGLTDVAFVPCPAGGRWPSAASWTGRGAPAHAVFWIAGDGTLEALTPLTPQQRGTKALRLVATGDGAAWLFNGDAWFRFDPWQSAFVTPDDSPTTAPTMISGSAGRRSGSLHVAFP